MGIWLDISIFYVQQLVLRSVWSDPTVGVSYQARCENPTSLKLN